MKISILTLILILFQLGTTAQDLTLDSCWNLAEKNYPRLKQMNILDRLHEIEQNNIGKKWLPDFKLMGTAAYLSVPSGIELSLGGAGSQPMNLDINQDIYAAALLVEQVIYSGGAIKSQKLVTEAQLMVDQELLEVERLQLKKRINDLYFRILLLNKNQKNVEQIISTLDARLEEAKAAVRNGAAIESTQYNLEAEVLRGEQKLDEVVIARETFIKMLSILTGTELTLETNFIEPVLPNNGNSGSTIRPELELLALKSAQIDAQKGIINSANLPKISGMGAATEAILESSNTLLFAGIILQWDIVNWNLNKNKKQQLLIQQEKIATEEATVSQSIAIEHATIDGEIARYTRLMERDAAIIDLKSKVLTAAESQLKNGTITSATYIQYVHERSNAQIDYQTHKIALLEAQFKYYTITQNL